jgi:isopentenyl-diphosphate Delta-isomerase
MALSASERKADHLRLAASPGVQHAVSTGLERVRLRHRALPERDRATVSLRTRLLDRSLEAPLVISAMTGGTDAAEEVNRRLLRAAAANGIALVLGSGRRLLDDPDLLRTYRPSGEDRPPLLLANLGAVQVAGRENAWRSEQLVDLLDADGLSIHLNALQEAVQPEGEPSFAGVLEGIERAVARLAPRPVVVKEVGFGLDFDDVAALRAVGVAAVDVAGAGGTNWALIEGERDPRAGDVAQAFADWGTPTVEALADARQAAPDLPIIASGGLRDGVDVAKCLALGATAGGLAAPFLRAAQAGRATEAVAVVIDQLRTATWLAGAPGAQELSGTHLR